MKKEHHETDSEDDDDDSDIAFATMNFDGVDFDNETDETDNVVDLEEQLVFYSHSTKKKSGEEDDDNGDDEKTTQHCRYLARLVAEGKYLEAMNSLSGFFDLVVTNQGHESSSSSSSVGERLRLAVMEYGQESLEKCLELELLAIASLNFFLQLNYTGPTLEHLLRSDQKHIDVTKEAEQNAQRQLLERVHPHACFVGDFHKPPNDDNDEEEEEGTTQVNNDDNSSNKNNNNKSSPDASRSFQTAVLTELTVDGEWPCPVAQGPYFLWLARCILFTLTWPLRDDWKVSRGSTNTNDRPDGGNAPPSFLDWVSRLKAVSLWNARASVAHERLLQSRYPTTTLWQETKASFGRALDAYCSSIKDNDDNDKAISNEAAATLEDRQRAAMVVLEWGLAQHHSDRPGKGKLMFHKAQDYSGLKMGITGAMGKRTKFQQESKAQMLVHAESASAATRDKATASNEDTEGPTRVQHSEDEIRLERIAYEEDDDNLIKHLTILDQAIVLAFCLDVKNHNPADGLTAEEMGAYLARVLDHHDDWMVYSTALLERAWLEFESSHGRERALLQLQALLDQHTTRLTLTQSTFDSVESSAPAQERLVHLHSIVYPPRWVLQRDIAERYAALGIVTSAAELFQEIELWDDVVDCYQRAGKENKAEQIVRERLEHQPTPRMWAALGDITKEPEHYHEALKLSNGRYSDAFVALGHYHFDKGELQQAAEFYREAVKVRPLSPFVWFRLGTVSMQLHDWDSALHAFSEVVQQEPEESDAWANVAAVHMHNRQPLEAYPALNEHNRNNWRVWVSKLHTCLDLEKYDEAVQACHVLLDFRSTREGVAGLEEKCVRGIVGGILKQHQESQNDPVALDSARRSLSRVHELLNRLSSETKSEAWVWETIAFFHEHARRDQQAMIDNLMKEYRALMQSGWERDENQAKKVVKVVTQIADLHRQKGTKENVTKAKFLVKNVVGKVESVYLDRGKVPHWIEQLISLQQELEQTSTRT